MKASLLRLAIPLALYAGCGGASSAGADLVSPADDGGATGDGSMSGGDGGGTDSGQQAANPDASKSSDGGRSAESGVPGGDTTALTCGTTTCSIPLQACCVQSVGNGTRSYSCDVTCPTSPGGNGGAGLRCSGAANCPANTVCCVSRPNGNTATSACQATCNGNNDAQLCDPKAANSGCPLNVQCSSKNIGDWGLPGGYATCGGVGN